MSDFDTDKAQLLNDLRRSRAQLNDVVGKLSTERSFERTPRKLACVEDP